MSFTPDWTEVQPQNKWKILKAQKTFALWAIFTSVGSMMTGFDWGITGNAAALPEFQKQFGQPATDGSYIIPAPILSGWSGASTGGDIVGILISGYLMDVIGRKHTLAVGTLITSVGVAIQVASSEWKLFLVGRLVNAIGFGMVYIISPVWIGETVRPEIRGFWLCLMNSAIVLGQFILAVVAEGLSHVQGQWGYRALLILQFLFVVPLFGLYPWFPESPYHLMKKGNSDGARKSLNAIHGSKDQTLIEAEMIRIRQNITFSEELKAASAEGGAPILQCLQRRHLKRTLIAILPAAEQQLVGSTFVLGFITYFMSLIGISNYFLVTVLLSLVMLISACVAFPLIEAVGRRTLLLWGTWFLTAMLLVQGVTGCFDTSAAVWVFLVSVFLWGAVYQATLGSVAFALGSEIHTLPLRPAAVSLMGTTQFIFIWIVSFIMPYLINPDAAHLGAKIGFIFFGLSFPVCILMFFIIPETKGLSFEELDYLFASKVSCRRFQEAIRERQGTSDGVLAVEMNGQTLKTEVKAAHQIETVTQ